MIDGCCHSVEIKEKAWPVQFVAVPRIGELVTSIDKMKSSKIVYVSHCQDSNDSPPYIKVYLE